MKISALLLHSHIMVPWVSSFLVPSVPSVPTSSPVPPSAPTSKRETTSLEETLFLAVFVAALAFQGFVANQRYFLRMYMKNLARHLSQMKLKRFLSLFKIVNYNILKGLHCKFKHKTPYILCYWLCCVF